MRKNKKHKREKVGYALLVKFANGFDSRGGLFRTRYDAEQFHASSALYKHLQYRIQGVRVNCELEKGPETHKLDHLGHQGATKVRAA